jgi:cytochrome d ubiquinol oxidase subunit I
MAAYEGLFTTTAGADLLLFGIIDEDQQTVHAKLAIPNLLSFLTKGSSSAEIAGLDTAPANERPPLALTFYSYRAMVIFGIYFGVLLLVGLLLHFRKRLATSRRYLAVLMWTSPLGITAIELGWIATEVGRQPWIVQGMLKTKDAASSVVPAGQILTTLIIFVVVYALLFWVWFRTMKRTIVAGPAAVPAVAAAGGPPSSEVVPALAPVVVTEEVER